MNSDETHPTGFGTLARSLVRNRELVAQLVRQEVLGRYRGSFFGVAWSLLTPLLMLAIYTFVFSVVFTSRWSPEAAPGNGEFAVILFAGLAVFGIFADCVVRAPTLVLNNANYVSRIVFPLEVLPVVALGTALFTFAAGMVVWVVAALVIMGGLPWTALLLPVIVLPLVVATLGVSWILASLGVYLRDVGQVTSILVTGLLFLSPIFYPVEAVPEKYRVLLLANPMGFIVDSARGALVFGRLPSLTGWLAAAAGAVAIAWLGFWWFQKTRKGFADVL
jgi:lipopolysaccharide transport system permease protein